MIETLKSLRSMPMYAKSSAAIDYVERHANQIPAIITRVLEEFSDPSDYALVKVRDTLTDEERATISDIATVRLVDCAIMDGPRRDEAGDWSAVAEFAGFADFEAFAHFHLTNISNRLMLQLLAARSTDGDADYILS